MLFNLQCDPISVNLNFELFFKSLWRSEDWSGERSGAIWKCLYSFDTVSLSFRRKVRPSTSVCVHLNFEHFLKTPHWLCAVVWYNVYMLLMLWISGECAPVRVNSVWLMYIVWRPAVVHQSFEDVTWIPAFSISLLHTMCSSSWRKQIYLLLLHCCCFAAAAAKAILSSGHTATGDINIAGKTTI